MAAVDGEIPLVYSSKYFMLTVDIRGQWWSFLERQAFLALVRVQPVSTSYGDVMAQGRFDSCTKISILVLLEEWGSSPWHHLLFMLPRQGWHKDLSGLCNQTLL